MDLIDDPAPGRNTPEFTVGEIASAVKRLVEAELGWVRVRGEVGRVTLARSGHLYFDLKDDRNVLSCMTWKGQMPAIGVMPEEGLEVVAEGRMTASGFQSRFSLNALHISVAGEGALMALLEKRKKALAAEGLFAADRKKPLPYLPDVIGVVTSPQGAVIRDILHRLRDRFPRHVLVWPVAVQGAACAPEVARAIEGFNALTPGGAVPRPDLLIVARGGGSIEDLWGFNEDVVARAAAASEIPLISAVGHETDTTLIDYVSDYRAPTPTAAAERAVPVRLDLLAWTDAQSARLTLAVRRAVEDRRTRLVDLSRALPRADGLTSQARQRLDYLEARLPKALSSATAQQKLRLVAASSSLRPAQLRRTLIEHRSSFQARAERVRRSVILREITRSADRLERASHRLDAAFAAAVASARTGLDGLERLRQTLGYRATLARGFAVVRGPKGVVAALSEARTAEWLEIEFADGRLRPEAAPLQSPAKPRSGGAGPKRATQRSTEQGDLFET